MYVKSQHDTVSLEEQDDFSRFHISGDTQSSVFKAISENAGDGHFWLEADAIIRISGRSEDEDWVIAFWQMLEKAEPYGFSDIAGRRIKAHVVRSG